jgi:glycosyltransferase involved in cell wall biosynthesis
VDRGIWDMLDVFRGVHNSLPAASLHLIGPIDEAGLEQEITEWLRNNSLSESVHLHGRIPNEQTFDIIRHNGVGLCLLRKNVFSAIEPTKIFEYMMTSLPVIVTDCQLWKAIVENDKCGIAIDPANISESADSVVSLLNDEQRLKELGRNGLNAVSAKFNWGTEEAKLLSLYRNLVGCRREN